MPHLPDVFLSPFRLVLAFGTLLATNPDAHRTPSGLCPPSSGSDPIIPVLICIQSGLLCARPCLLSSGFDPIIPTPFRSFRFALLPSGHYIPASLLLSSAWVPDSRTPFLSVVLARIADMPLPRSPVSRFWFRDVTSSGHPSVRKWFPPSGSGYNMQQAHELVDAGDLYLQGENPN
ncbi:hypothetical protein C8F01DRAFT_1352479 [Mycena amicta]|nr:hypothetical protein C8F01DRAFT_1352479 [Mycena amicta]